MAGPAVPQAQHLSVEKIVANSVLAFQSGARLRLPPAAGGGPVFAGYQGGLGQLRAGQPEGLPGCRSLQLEGV